jgi:hypothetical protein
MQIEKDYSAVRGLIKTFKELKDLEGIIERGLTYERSIGEHERVLAVLDAQVKELQETAAALMKSVADAESAHEEAIKLFTIEEYDAKKRAQEARKTADAVLEDLKLRHQNQVASLNAEYDARKDTLEVEIARLEQRKHDLEAAIAAIKAQLG